MTSINTEFLIFIEGVELKPGGSVAISSLGRFFFSVWQIVIENLTFMSCHEKMKRWEIFQCGHLLRWHLSKGSSYTLQSDRTILGNQLQDLSKLCIWGPTQTIQLMCIQLGRHLHYIAVGRSKEDCNMCCELQMGISPWALF